MKIIHTFHQIHKKKQSKGYKPNGELNDKGILNIIANYIHHPYHHRYIFGLILLLLPELHAAALLVTFTDPTIRAFGAMMIGLTIGSFLALRSKEWSKVKILVEIELIWLILAIIANLYHMFFPPVFGPFGWLTIALLLLLFILFLLSYYKEIKSQV